MNTVIFPYWSMNYPENIEPYLPTEVKEAYSRTYITGPVIDGPVSQTMSFEVHQLQDVFAMTEAKLKALEEHGENELILEGENLPCAIVGAEPEDFSPEIQMSLEREEDESSGDLMKNSSGEEETHVLEDPEIALSLEATTPLPSLHPIDQDFFLSLPEEPESNEKP